MKKIIMLASIGLLIVGLGTLFINQSSSRSSTQYETLNYTVNGMVCASCQVKIEQSLAELDPVISVTANHRTGDVTVLHDGSISGSITRQEIVNRLTNLGFTIIQNQSKLELLEYQFSTEGIE